MILADTAYWCALLQPRDSLHARAHNWTDSLSTRETLLITECVYWETANFLANSADRGKAVALLNGLQTNQDVVWIEATPALFAHGVTLYTDRSDKDWSLTDCISFVVMRQRGITRALTYDHHFEQAGFEALLRRDPPG